MFSHCAVIAGCSTWTGIKGRGFRVQEALAWHCASPQLLSQNNNVPCFSVSSVASVFCESGVAHQCSCSILGTLYSCGKADYLLIAFLFVCFIFMYIEEIRIWYLGEVQSDARSWSSLIAEVIAQTSNYLVQSFDNLIFLLISCSLCFHTNATDF